MTAPSTEQPSPARSTNGQPWIPIVWVDNKEPYADTSKVSAMTPSAETRASDHAMARVMEHCPGARAP